MLLVEVSDSSLDHVRKTKLPLYAKFGVPEAWIIDLSHRAVEIPREPAGGRYASVERMTEGVLAPTRIPAIRIDIAALLG
jgi:Uma2 family endonuclease